MTYHRAPGTPLSAIEKPRSNVQLTALVTGQAEAFRSLTTAELDRVKSGEVTMENVRLVPPKPLSERFQQVFVSPIRGTTATAPVAPVEHRQADVDDLTASARQYGVNCAPAHDTDGIPVFVVMGHSGLQHCKTVEEAETLMRATAAIRSLGV